MSEVNDFQFKVILQCEQEEFNPTRKEYCEYLVDGQVGKASNELNSYLLHQIRVHLVVDEAIYFQDAAFQATAVLQDSFS